MFVVLISIKIVFFLYHVAISNPGYVNLAAVAPWAIKVSGNFGECIEAASWWVLYGARSRSFVVRSVVIYPSIFLLRGEYIYYGQGAGSKVH